MKKKFVRTVWVIVIFFCSDSFRSIAQVNKPPIRVVLAGLSHDHVNGILQHYQHPGLAIVGIAESNPELVQRYQKRFKLADSIFYKDLSSAVNRLKPDAVMAFNAIEDHLDVVKTCAPLGIHVMVEKPLAVSVRHAEQMAELARKNNIQLLTNYETTWYASNQYVFRKVIDSNAIGEIRKMVVHDGHEGPKEIGVSKEFLGWLTDPQKNGGGAIIDFGCYGANLMTWLMKGQTPQAVTAVTRRIKPDVYPKVDDDAMIILEYPGANGIIEASWNWPFSIKDMEVFGKTGYLQAVNNNTIRIREKGNQPYKVSELKPPVAPYQDYVSYLSAILRKEISGEHDLSSLENNLVVVKILEAARQSAKEGKRIVLTGKK